MRPRLLCLAAAALLLPLPASARPHPLRWLAHHKAIVLETMVECGAAAADVASSEQMLSRGYVERNPVYGSHPTLARYVAIKAAFIVPAVWLTWRLDRRGNRLSAAALASAVAAPQTWAAASNWALAPAPPLPVRTCRLVRHKCE